MKTIFKYPLNPEVTAILMPRGAEILSVQMQHDRPVLWAKVETGQIFETRRFRIFGTGHEVDDMPLRFIDTFQMDGGSLVFHVFEEAGGEGE